MYWTGEKVVQAQDRFRTFLAIHDGKVVGYMDVTYIFKENEPFDLFVLEEYRRMGYGRKLLAKALERNAPNRMMLLVDIDNDPAISEPVLSAIFPIAARSWRNASIICFRSIISSSSSPPASICSASRTRESSSWLWKRQACSQKMFGT